MNSNPPQQPSRLSFVIPIYNGAKTIGDVVAEIHRTFPTRAIEIVLVNDGSADDSEAVCSRLQSEHPHTVTFVHLARNFGEHGAVLAGLRQSTGDLVAILDDDGQNPPAEVERLIATLVEERRDVVVVRSGEPLREQRRRRQPGSLALERPHGPA